MKAKKLVALSMAGAMAFTSPMVAFAATSGNGSTTGTGTSNGHLDQSYVSVTLPANDATTFNYIADPERLVQATFTSRNAADNSVQTGVTKSGTEVTPNTKGIYFTNGGAAATPATDASVTAFSVGDKTESTAETGESVTVATTMTATALSFDGTDWKDGDGNAVTSDVTVTGLTPASGDTITVSPYVAGTSAGSATYSETSDKLKVVNNSSKKVNLTLEAKVAANTNNMAFASSDTFASDLTTPTLYMDLKTQKKGDSAAADSVITTTDGVTSAKKEIELTGTPANFEVTQSGTGTDGAYAYSLKGSIAADDTSWDSAEFWLTGACAATDITANTVAPAIEMTWSWADPDAAASATVMTKVAATGNVRGEMATPATGTLTALKINGTARNGQISSGMVTYNNGVLKFEKASVDNLMSTAGEYTIVATIGGTDYNFKYTAE